MTQVWCAEDTSAGGYLSNLSEWFLLLCSQGPHFGYFLEPSKCFIVVASFRLSAAKVIFGDLNIQVVTVHRFLVGYIGDSGDRHKFVLQKVLEWSDQVKTLAAVASQPHAACSSYFKVLAV